MIQTQKHCNRPLDFSPAGVPMFLENDPHMLNDPYIMNEPYMLNEDTAFLCILELDSDLKSYASDFLLYGGILAGHSDGHFTLEELAYLSESLSPLFDNPDVLMKALLSPDMAVLSFEKAMSWLKENGDEIKHSLLRCLSGLAAADHVLRDREVRFIQNTSRGLGVSSEEGKRILFQALQAKNAQLKRKRNLYRNTLPLFCTIPPRSANLPSKI